MTLALPEYVTEAEFLALPESTNHVELLDGEVIMPPEPSFWHQEVVVRLVETLRSWAREQPGPVTVGLGPIDIRFAPGRILQPDAFVLFAAVPREQSGPLEHVPEVCVEVLSTNRIYDRVTKRYVYAEAGVAEYWIVDPKGLVERRTGQGLEHFEYCQRRLESALLPGFALDVEALFADPK